MSKKFVFNTETIKEVEEKIKEGYTLPRFQNPFYKGEFGVRRAGLSFDFTQEELIEYAKCKYDIHYFSEKYCKIKREDGSVGSMKLRDYQKKIMDLYSKNRFSILMSSRQVGKCFLFNSILELYDNETGKITKLPFFEVYYMLLPKRTLIDRVKYYLYKTIFYLENNK